MLFYKLNGEILPKVRLVDSIELTEPYLHQYRHINEYVLYFVVKGDLYIEENGVKYHLTKGDILLLDPEYSHGGWKDSVCEYYYIYFRHSEIERGSLGSQEKNQNRQSYSPDNEDFYGISLSFSMIFPKIIHLGNTGIFLKLLRLLEEAKESYKNPLKDHRVLCSIKMLEFFEKLSVEYVTTDGSSKIEGKSKACDKVCALVNYLNLHYSKTISSRKIEELFECNFDYLNRVFKKYMGITIFSYLKECRIYKACELLETAPIKISVLSRQVGFTDESYFYKVFKKKMGITPSQYAKQKK